MFNIINYIWGYDFFVSYAHNDGEIIEGGQNRSNYVRKLVEKLREKGFKVFHDESEYDLGVELNAGTQLKVKSSSKLLVIARTYAMKSMWVLKEIEVANKNDNDIVVIDINGTYENTSPKSPVRKAIGDTRLRFPERLENNDGEPSQELIDKLVSASKNARRDRRRIQIISLITLILLGLTVFSLYQRDIAREQTEIAETRLNRAESNLLVTRSDALSKTEPDKALSLALDAWERDKNNSVAHKAVLRSYYEPDAFPIHLLKKNLPGSFGTSISYFAQVFDKDSKSIWIVDRGDSKKLINVSLNGVQSELKLTKPVYDFRLDPKDNGFLSVNQSGATLWDRNGTIIQEYPYSGASFATMSPDGERVMVAGGYEGAAQIFNRQGESLTRLCCHNNTIQHGDFAIGDSGWISTAGNKKTNIWNANGELQYTIDHEDYVTSATISPNGEFFATTTWDSRVQVWWLATGKQLKSLPGHSSRVYSASFSPDGEKLVTASWDGTIRVWDARSLYDESLMILPTVEGQNVVTWSNDGNWLVASGSKTVTLWNVTATKHLSLGFKTQNEMKPELMTHKTFEIKGDYRAVTVYKDDQKFFSFEIPFSDRIYQGKFTKGGKFIDATSKHRFPFSPEAIRNLVYTHKRFGSLKQSTSK